MPPVSLPSVLGGMHCGEGGAICFVIFEVLVFCRLFPFFCIASAHTTGFTQF